MVAQFGHENRTLPLRIPGIIHVFSNADFVSAVSGNQPLNPRAFRCSFQSRGKPFLRRSRDNSGGMSPRAMDCTISGARNASLIRCKLARTFDPVSAPIRCVSYWFLVKRWVNIERRFTDGFAVDSLHRQIQVPDSAWEKPGWGLILVFVSH